MATEKRKLPHPADVIDALYWLRAGCPAVHYAFKEKKDVGQIRKTLLELLDALPSHFPQYAYGTPENKAAMAEPTARESRKRKKP